MFWIQYGAGLSTFMWKTDFLKIVNGCLTKFILSMQVKIFWILVGIVSHIELLVQKYCMITISLLLSWCPYMVTNVSVQCKGGLLPNIILLTLCDSIGESFQYHAEFLSLQPMFPPKPFDLSEGLDAFRFFFQQNRRSHTCVVFCV